MTSKVKNNSVGVRTVQALDKHGAFSTVFVAPGEEVEVNLHSVKGSMHDDIVQAMVDSGDLSISGWKVSSEAAKAEDEKEAVAKAEADALKKREAAEADIARRAEAEAEAEADRATKATGKKK